MVIYVMTQCSRASGYKRLGVAAASVFRIANEDGGSIFLQAFGDHAPDCGGVVTWEIAM